MFCVHTDLGFTSYGVHTVPLIPTCLALKHLITLSGSDLNVVIFSLWTPASRVRLCDIPGDGDALGIAVLCCYGLLQLIQLTGLLELLHQALHSLFAPLLLLPVLLSSPCSPWPTGRLLPPEQPLHNRRGERQDGGHFGDIARRL